jgi:peptidoglycan/xylan/chitin deacetylase (PgdA/CDA1 family)
VSDLSRRLGAPPPRDLMMSSDALRACARAGVRIGAHTASHPILARLDDAEAEREMRAGRDALEAIVDARIGLFAYPNGRRGKDYDARHVEMARRLGFDAAFSTEPGAGGAHDDRHELPRFTPWDRTAWRFHLRMMRNLHVR